MSANDRIDRYLRDVLHGSEVPLPDRAAIGEELRDHIESLARTHELAGQDSAQAAEAAITAFGPAVVVRNSLRIQQRSALWRTRWSSLWRTCGFWALAFAVLTVVLVFARGSGGFWRQVLQGAVFYVCSLVSMVGIGSVVVWLCPPIEVCLPRGEMRLAQQGGRWLLTALGVLVGSTLLAVLMLFSATPILAGQLPVLIDDPTFLARAVLGDLWREGVAEPLLLRIGAATIIACGVALIAQYMRSPTEPAATAR